ncbi:hypothetical protein [Holospora undulata]|uniref:Uncharacterized protein n=1 Tax=Holospora undulata HU1 TaxID=1321371 RepID=A0A061JG35_9PROT|nr:hypothetical protein [Holospora undulata]ETZ04745.1 hypothetical protein K737_300837 [Holospora undulata HU1]
MAKALLIDDQSLCRNLSHIWKAITYIKVSDICAYVLEARRCTPIIFHLKTAARPEKTDPAKQKAFIQR